MTSAERGAYVGLAFTSILTSATVAVMILYNPKLRIHPSKLIGYMCLCEAASCFSALLWVINPLNYICYFGIHYLWRYTAGYYIFLKHISVIECLLKKDWNFCVTQIALCSHFVKHSLLLSTFVFAMTWFKLSEILSTLEREEWSSTSTDPL